MGYSAGWGGIGNATMSSAAIASMAAGMGAVVPQHDASDAEKAQISLWAKQAGKDDRAAYESAVRALASVNPWGPDGPHWYTSVGNGGWYAYSDVTTMLSTTVAERHPEWLTAVGTVVGTAADVTFAGGAVGASVGSPTAVNVDAISTGVVNVGGSALTAAGDVASAGAIDAKKAACAAIPGATWDDVAKTCTLPDVSTLKRWLLGGAALLVAVGGGYAYVAGRGMRRSNPAGRRAAPPRVPFFSARRSRASARPNRRAVVVRGRAA
jgi:hypothetical protein